jgi:hypothetical protein
MREEDSAVAKEWCYSEILGGQRTDIKIISGY